MGVLNENTKMGAAAAAGGGYEINNSLRFNDDDSASLSFTPSSAGNRKTWSVSFWFKGQTPFKKRNDMYDEEFRKEVADYADKTDNNYGAAKKFRVSRGSVQNWREKYYGSRY